MEWGLEILLVEDDQTFAESFSSLFGVYNRITLAFTMKEAHAALKKKAFDTVLLDKSLPDGEGIELIADVRSLSPRAAIIIITGDKNYHSVVECLRAGADDYVLKSDQFVQDLLARIPISVTAAKARYAKQHQVCLDLPDSSNELTPSHYQAYRSLSEQFYLERALQLCAGDVQKTADHLGLGRSTLFKRLSELGIERRPWQRKQPGPTKRSLVEL